MKKIIYDIGKNREKKPGEKAIIELLGDHLLSIQKATVQENERTHEKRLGAVNEAR